MAGLLVNDTLTCIPGTETLWHDLLRWIPNLQDGTNGHTPFNILSSFAEKIIKEERPDFIIRNCTFFPPLSPKVPTISLLQDIYRGGTRRMQLEVANKSDIVVMNSDWTRSFYPEISDNKIRIIPLGVDFEFFKPSRIPKTEPILLFIGDSSNDPKGFDLLSEIIEKTNYRFFLIMKDGHVVYNARVKTYSKIGKDMVRGVIQQCSALICTSTQESQHLAGIEAAACGLPLITTNVGIYSEISPDIYGARIEERNSNKFISEIERVLSSNINPREEFMKRFSKEIIKKKWQSVVEEVIKK